MNPRCGDRVVAHQTQFAAGRILIERGHGDLRGLSAVLLVLRRGGPLAASALTSRQVLELSHQKQRVPPNAGHPRIGQAQQRLPVRAIAEGLCSRRHTGVEHRPIMQIEVAPGHHRALSGSKGLSGAVERVITQRFSANACVSVVHADRSGAEDLGGLLHRGRRRHADELDLDNRRSRLSC